MQVVQLAFSDCLLFVLACVCTYRLLCYAVYTVRRRASLSEIAELRSRRGARLHRYAFPHIGFRPDLIPRPLSPTYQQHWEYVLLLLFASLLAFLYAACWLACFPGLLSFALACSSLVFLLHLLRHVCAYLWLSLLTVLLALRPLRPTVPPPQNM
jgi:hypothetical protein